MNTLMLSFTIHVKGINGLDRSFSVSGSDETDALQKAFEALDEKEKEDHRSLKIIDLF